MTCSEFSFSLKKKKRSRWECIFQNAWCRVSMRPWRNSHFLLNVRHAINNYFGSAFQDPPNVGSQLRAFSSLKTKCQNQSPLALFWWMKLDGLEMICNVHIKLLEFCFSVNWSSLQFVIQLEIKVRVFFLLSYFISSVPLNQQNRCFGISLKTFGTWGKAMLG